MATQPLDKKEMMTAYIMLNMKKTQKQAEKYIHITNKMLEERAAMDGAKYKEPKKAVYLQLLRSKLNLKEEGRGQNLTRREAIVLMHMLRGKTSQKAKSEMRMQEKNKDAMKINKEMALYLVRRIVNPNFLNH